MSPDSTQDPAGTSATPSSASINGTMPGWAAHVDDNPLPAFVDSCLRGVGQVCFMNNPVTGLAILVAMFVAEGWLGFAGALGLVVSTLAAIGIGMDRGAIRAGLFGFNGVLVGAGLSLFLQPDWNGAVMVCIVVASAFSTVLHAALANVFIGARKVPPFTRIQFHHADLPHRRTELRERARRWPDRARRRAGHRRIGQQHAPLGGRGGVREQPGGVRQRDLPRHRPAVLRQQRGRGNHHRRRPGRVLAHRRDLRRGRLGRRHAHRPRVGASGVAIYNCRWGFNSFDAALAIGGVFYVLTLRSGVLAVACAVPAALVFGAIGSLFIPYGLPALTLPFCFATLAFVLLKGASTELEPVAVEEITTPEEHLSRMRSSEGVGRDAVPA